MDDKTRNGMESIVIRGADERGWRGWSGVDVVGGFGFRQNKFYVYI